MALAIMRNSVPLDQLYGAKGASTATATGCMQNGVDVNQYILALADGHALGFNAGISKNGTDFSSFFGVPNGNTPLPINGQSFSAFATSGTGASVASVTFGVTSTGWSVSRVQSPGSSGTMASGSNPSGAVTVQYTLTITSSTTSTSSSNGAPAPTALSSSPFAVIQANGAPLSPERDITATLKIDFFNSSSVNISSTIINLAATATGSA